MTTNSLKDKLQDAVKAAMRAQEKSRLGVIRLIMAALKQKEVDERVELTDTDILAILDKMLSQRRDSINQFGLAGRQDLVDKEQFEVSVIQEFLPVALSQEEITHLVQDAIAQLQAKSISDMAKVMSFLKPKLQGRADMGAVSAMIKGILAS